MPNSTTHYRETPLAHGAVWRRVECAEMESR